MKNYNPEIKNWPTTYLYCDIIIMNIHSAHFACIIFYLILRFHEVDPIIASIYKRGSLELGKGNDLKKTLKLVNQSRCIKRQPTK